MSDSLISIVLWLIEWVLTFTVHSTIFLALAWIFCRFVMTSSLILRELLFRTAFFGALITAVVQVFAGVSSWEVTIPLAVQEHEAEVGRSFMYSDDISNLSGRMENLMSHELSGFVSDTPRVSRPSRHSLYSLIPLLFFALWFSGMTFGLLRLVRSGFILSKTLRNRIPVGLPPEYEPLMSVMGIRKIPDLTESAEIVAPMAFGIRRSEICFPRGLLQSLSRGERISLFAHEAAHIIRRDPLWRFLYRILRAVFFFNPLLVRSLQSLELIAEFLCDQTAAARAGNNIVLARCILQFAQYSSGGPSMSAFTSAITYTSSVGQRIRRLLDQPHTDHGRCNALVGFCLVIVLIAATCMFPTIACSRVGQSAEIHGAPVVDADIYSEGMDAETSDVGSSTEDGEEPEGDIYTRYLEEVEIVSDEEVGKFEEENAALIEEIEEATRIFEEEHAEEIRQLTEAAEKITLEHEEQLRLTEEEMGRFEEEHAEEIRQLAEAADRLAEEYDEQVRLAEEAARDFEEKHAAELRRLGEAHDRYKEKYGEDFEENPELRHQFEEEHAREIQRLEDAARQYEIQPSIHAEIQQEIQSRFEEENAENIKRLEEAARRFEKDLDLKAGIHQDIQQRIEEELGEEIKRLEEATRRFEAEQSGKVERLEEAARVLAEKHRKELENSPRPEIDPGTPENGSR